MFSKILVGTDGSATADAAVSHAVALAERLGSELLVATAYRGASGTGSPFGREEGHAGVEIARSVLEREVERHGDRLRLRPVLREGHPADVLIDVAEEEDVDVVVMGNRGMTEAKRFLIGSVPNNVSHHAPCHVLIVHTSWAEGARSDKLRSRPLLYRKLLIGTDGSPTALKAVRLGAELAAGVGSEVLLVYAGSRERGEPVLEDAAAEVRDLAPVSWKVAEGNAAEALVDMAVREDCDLIVVGNKGMTGPGRFLMGSVPNSVSHHAPGNVLIAKTA